MSPRTDSYLSVCLQEASKSPLHYRHGCIVVSGGKIIGKGFNDYRPGFNGGALKTGKLATSSALNGPALAAIKQKQKSKSKLHLHLGSTTVGNEQKSKPNATFTPFETAAIGSSGGAPWNLKAPLALLGGWKNHASNYRVVVNENYAYGGSKPTSRPSAVGSTPPSVATPTVASLPFKRHALKQLHVNAVKDKVCECNDNNKKEEEKEEQKKKQNVRALPGKSAEKISVQNQYGYHHEEKYQGRVHHHGVKYGRQRQQYYAHREPLTLRIPVKTDSVASVALAGIAHPPSPSEPQSHLARGHLKTSPTILVPCASTEVKAYSVTDRMKDPRLRGADLYVARLGWKKQEIPELSPTTSSATHFLPRDTTVDLPPSENKMSTGSLHEELKLAGPLKSTVHQLPVCEKPSVSASRPCYRCICYMHTVGIKRVFWTNDKGEWEGGKVRDMMDALELAGASGDGRGQSDGLTGGAAGIGVFVTKHEVLKLRRLMGSPCS